MKREEDYGWEMQEAPQMWHHTEMESLKSENSNNIVKPLLNGFLTGEIHVLLIHGIRSITLSVAQSDPDIKKMLPESIRDVPHMTRLKICNQMLKRELLLGATHTTVSLGLFEILKTKLRKANNGMPLTLYQEACCGLTSGVAAAFVWQPFRTAESRVSKQNWTYRNCFSTISQIVRNEGVSTLWRGSGLFMGTLAVSHMGMLASYKPSLDYLVESRGLSYQSAQMSAGFISGFFTAVCIHPFNYLLAVQKQYDGGDKNAYKYIPHYVSRVLGGSDFYIRFLKTFHANAVFCMMRWWIYEKVTHADLSTQDILNIAPSWDVTKGCTKVEELVGEKW